MEQIYIQYMPQVYKYLFSLCQEEFLAEELTQEVFCQAIKYIDSFRGECRLYVWLCQIGKHLWIKEIEKRKKEKHVSLENSIQGDTDIEDMHIQKEERMRFYKTLHVLDEATKEVMLLRLSGEFGFKEIGEIMGRNETWARVTFYRGKQKIREELGL